MPHWPGPCTMAPPFITRRTLRRVVMSRVGSPSTATRSARRPATTVPRRSSRCRRPRGDGRGGPQRLGRREAALDQQLQLAGTLAVWEHAHVAAVDEDDPRRPGRPDGRAGLLQPGRLGAGTRPPAGELAHRLGGRERRTERDLAPAMSRKSSASPPSPCSIVSTPASTARLIPSRHRVGRHRHARRSGRLHDASQLLERE